MRCLTNIALLFVFLALIGCDSVFYKKSFAFSGDQWNYDDPIRFDFEISDTAQVYNMILTLDHNDIFPYQNLYLKTQTDFPDNTQTEQMLSLELANEAGFWFGDCKGSNCTLQIPIQSKVHFIHAGKHRLSLEQYTRSDTLIGISSISISLEVVQ